jgi:hypothetical protein
LHVARCTLHVLIGLTAACSRPPESPRAVARPPEPGERFFRGLRQLTFGGQNAEAYFSQDGTRLIFQRHQADSTCDQQYVMKLDGSGLRRISNGLGRTTCGYFYDHDRRVLYSSTFEHDRRCPPRPDYSNCFFFDMY